MTKGADVSDAVGNYQNALREVERAAKAAERIAKVVESAGKALAQWQRAVVSNAPGGGGYPARIGGSPHSPSINASDWPSAADIHAALVAYHAARAAQMAAWSAIPAENRIGLSPPTPN